jgi:hypothetical protein
VVNRCAQVAQTRAQFNSQIDAAEAAGGSSVRPALEARRAQTNAQLDQLAAGCGTA